MLYSVIFSASYLNVLQILMNVRLVLTHVIQRLEPIVPTLLVATTVPVSQDFMEMDPSVLVRMF